MTGLVLQHGGDLVGVVGEIIYHRDASGGSDDLERWLTENGKIKSRDAA